MCRNKNQFILEIVLAHEAFHAVQYHLMIDGNKTGEYLWTHSYCDKDYRDCVLEGLARWFEYGWCEQALSTNTIYQWHKDQLDDELHTYCYPGCLTQQLKFLSEEEYLYVMNQ